MKKKTLKMRGGGGSKKRKSRLLYLTQPEVYGKVKWMAISELVNLLTLPYRLRSKNCKKLKLENFQTKIKKKKKIIIKRSYNNKRVIISFGDRNGKGGVRLALLLCYFELFILEEKCYSCAQKISSKKNLIP